ncbi:MAG: ferric reductase-like transmembrane domain-containing protein [Actinomycetota bacterium]|nr:ferric reductase-like transmembrane domain-containing protein [Actinomycetota bacterium]
MMVVVSAGGSQLLWFVSRAAGLVLLVTLSVVVAMGVATRLGSALPGLPRFVTAELHRTLSLFAIALLALHVATALLDPYVSIGWLSAVVPFASHYRAEAIGLGALSVDLVGAVVATSVLRRRLGYGAWRAIHWLAYLSWPVALVHAYQSGPDTHLWWAAALEWGSVGIAATAIVARLLQVLRRGEGALAPRGVARLGGEPLEEDTT